MQIPLSNQGDFCQGDCEQGQSLETTLILVGDEDESGACKELFDRLVDKGKNKKLAVIAVANKLLKQVFGVVKNDCLFDRNYYKKSSLIYLVLCTVRVGRSFLVYLDFNIRYISELLNRIFQHFNYMCSKCCFYLKYITFFMIQYCQLKLFNHFSRIKPT